MQLLGLCLGTTWPVRSTNRAPRSGSLQTGSTAPRGCGTYKSEENRKGHRTISENLFCKKSIIRLFKIFNCKTGMFPPTRARRLNQATGRHHCRNAWGLPSTGDGQSVQPENPVTSHRSIRRIQIPAIAQTGVTAPSTPYPQLIPASSSRLRKNLFI